MRIERNPVEATFCAIGSSAFQPEVYEMVCLKNLSPPAERELHGNFIFQTVKEIDRNHLSRVGNLRNF